MNEYSVFIDVMEDRDSNEVKEVVSLTVEASNSDEALDKAKEIADKEYKSYYVWEVLEEDRI